VILTGLGSAGDVLPAVGVGRRLMQRGHDVVLIASDHFRPLAARSDLDFVGLGSDADYRRIIRDPAVFDQRRGLETVLRYTLQQLETVYAAVQRSIVPGRTVVGAHVLDFASRMLQEQGEVPVATLLLSPALLRSQYQVPILVGTRDYSRWPRWTKRLFWWATDRLVVDRLVLPDLNRIRARHGLASIRRPFDGWILSPRLTIGLFPDWFAPPQPDWPARVRLTSFPLFDAVEPMPAQLDEFLAAGSPPVVATFGTAQSRGGAQFDAAIRACQRLGRRSVLLSQFGEVPGSLPPGFIHVPFAPLTRLLPRSAALIHHGGIGTTAAGLMAGVPQLVVPLSHDQPDNGMRVRRLGAGDVIALGNRSSASVLGQQLASRLDALLSSEVVARRCAALAQRLRLVDGIALTCDLLESLQPSDRSAVA
jgi:UDP:flavonoid glycosyltransferase YjiC (YdhE family)